MDTLSYKTLTPNAQSVEKEWLVVDATDQVLGRLCAKVAILLRGKNKPCYSPFVECGDNVIIISTDSAPILMTSILLLLTIRQPGNMRHMAMNSPLFTTKEEHALSNGTKEPHITISARRLMIGMLQRGV